ARLRFVRWLVATGRLTDQLPEEDTSDKPKQIAEGNTSSKLDETPLDHGAGEPIGQVTQKEASCVSSSEKRKEASRVSSSEKRKEASRVSSSEKRPILKMVAARLNMKRLQHWLPPPSLVLYQFTIM